MTNGASQHMAESRQRFIFQCHTSRSGLRMRCICRSRVVLVMLLRVSSHLSPAIGHGEPLCSATSQAHKMCRSKSILTDLSLTDLSLIDLSLIDLSLIDLSLTDLSLTFFVFDILFFCNCSRNGSRAPSFRLGKVLDQGRAGEQVRKKERKKERKKKRRKSRVTSQSSLGVHVSALIHTHTCPLDSWQ